MPRGKPPQTLADYVAIAIGPALIMVLVGSLVLFLQQIIYQGPYQSQMRWVLFWFVFAAVLVSRIAIRSGSGYASVYGLLLAAATALVFVVRYPEAILPALVLLGVVWWCADRLTRDCTLIDESEDASGEGLLQAAGLQEGEHQAERRDRPHPPGMTVVYFSLLALPLFGIGQLLIPAEDSARRGYTFGLLWIYVAAALGLLLSTSFLGLRRYLRQKRLQMPTSMAAAWLGMGAVMVVVILVLCLLLPRPQARYSATALLDQWAGEKGKASDYAMVRGEAGKDEGRRIGDPEKQQQAGQQAGGRRGRNGQNAGQGKGRPQEGPQGEKRTSGGGQNSQQQSEGGQRSQQSQNGQNSQNRNNGDPNRQNQTGQGNKSQSQGGGQDNRSSRNEDTRGSLFNKDEPEQRKTADRQNAPAESQSRPPESSRWRPSDWLSGAANILKWVIYAIIAVAVCVLLIRYWSQIVEAVRRFLDDLRHLLGGGRSERHAEEVEKQPARVPPRPFASFQNPFLTGRADAMPPEELVVYTFQAVESWAAEQDIPRGPEQTPLEFGRRLSERTPEMAQEIRHATQLYARIAYAGHTPPRETVEPLEHLWRRMSEAAPGALSTRVERVPG